MLEEVAAARLSTLTSNGRIPARRSEYGDGPAVHPYRSQRLGGTSPYWVVPQPVDILLMSGAGLLITGPAGEGQSWGVMYDVLLVLGLIGFFGAAAGYAAWCGKL